MQLMLAFGAIFQFFKKNRQSIGRTKGGPKRTAPHKPTAVILSQATLKVSDPKFTLAS